MITFTVVTPVKNSALLLYETMTSVINQIGIGIDFRIQHIIVDGASTDNTLQTAKKFIKTHANSNITYIVISEPDKSMYEAITKGIRISAGEIFTYQNAGDLYHYGAFAAARHYFDQSEVKWLYGRKVTMNYEGSCVVDAVPIPYFKKIVNSGFHGFRKMNLGFFQQESLFIKSSELVSLDFEKFANFKLAGDFYLFQHLIQNGKGGFIDAFLSGHRIHLEQLSLDLDSYRKEMNALIVKPGLQQYFFALFLKLVSKLPQQFIRKFHKEIMKWDHNEKKWLIRKKNRN